MVTSLAAEASATRITGDITTGLTATPEAISLALLAFSSAFKSLSSSMSSSEHSSNPSNLTGEGSVLNLLGEGEPRSLSSSSSSSASMIWRRRLPGEGDAVSDLLNIVEMVVVAVGVGSTRGLGSRVRSSSSSSRGRFLLGVVTKATGLEGETSFGTTAVRRDVNPEAEVAGRFVGELVEAFKATEPFATSELATGFVGDVISFGGPKRLGEASGAVAFPLLGDVTLAAIVLSLAGVDGKKGLNLNLASNCAGRAAAAVEGLAGDVREGEVVNVGLRTGEEAMVRWRAGEEVEVVKMDFNECLMGEDADAAVDTEEVTGARDCEGPACGFDDDEDVKGLRCALSGDLLTFSGVIMKEMRLGDRSGSGMVVLNRGGSASNVSDPSVV